MARRAEVTFSYNFERIKKQLSVYERSQSKFAGKKALTRLNRQESIKFIYIKYNSCCHCESCFLYVSKSWGVRLGVY